MIEKCLIVGLGKIGLEYDIDKIDEPEIVLTHAKAFYLHSNFDLVGLNSSIYKIIRNICYSRYRIVNICTGTMVSCIDSYG